MQLKKQFRESSLLRASILEVVFACCYCKGGGYSFSESGKVEYHVKDRGLTLVLSCGRSLKWKIFCLCDLSYVTKWTVLSLR